MPVNVVVTDLGDWPGTSDGEKRISVMAINGTR
jgi:hypothetical protein